MVGWCDGVVYVASPGRPTDIGIHLGKQGLNEITISIFQEILEI